MREGGGLEVDGIVFQSKYVLEKWGGSPRTSWVRWGGMVRMGRLNRCTASVKEYQYLYDTLTISGLKGL
jgi:hypothetical protein